MFNSRMAQCIKEIIEDAQKKTAALLFTDVLKELSSECKALNDWPAGLRCDASEEREVREQLEEKRKQELNTVKDSMPPTLRISGLKLNDKGRTGVRSAVQVSKR